ncbi:chromosome segregation protein SMC [Penaeicola halotolerans]|uniref:chromosome segregation protein SMC n=1 Tax=Penaeicola halotolerans TaxID=2793196 RepID=UPI001CF88D20|nr:chromosome segregation protein SMC [Penaeicola halotolerans]
MQLTKLEIKGFKSFGDKVVINFDKGITGIVGPNGCGKSNVVDAIRWVLGEQKTRALRSEKMENIIFNGTKTRKPTNLAEVSLTFENTKNLLPTEYTTVTITRRYYRSGDSEYLLNGITCRLKDITNLFMDTGIASNSYAIIELKMIDELLNDKEGSRRDLFEEAAGISKFKKRKKETLKKLEDTDADLDRVEDLLFEIEKNLKTLERQAKQTEKYFQLKEQYKVLSIALAKKTVKKHTASFLTLNEQITAESDKKIGLSTQIDNAEARLEEAKAGLINQEKLLSSRQKTLNEHVHKIRTFESEKKIKNERLRFLEDRSAKLREQIDLDKKSNERAAFSISSLEQEKASAEKQLLENEALVDQLKAEYEEQKQQHASLQERVNINNRDYNRLKDTVYQLKKDIEIKQIQLSTFKQELEKTTSDDSEQTATLAGFEDKMQEVGAQLAEKEDALQQLKSKEAVLLQRTEEVNRTIDLIKEELTQSSRKLDAKQNEFSLTKSLVENLEGFPEAIKFLKKNSDWAKNAPLLSDILTTEEKYRVTVENFLEPYMNYYVVDTQEQAYTAVNLLSDAARGKANFFILDKFESFHPSPSKLYEQAIPATEIIEFESKYTKLISFILDKVYIVSGDFKDIPNDSESIFITQSGKFTKRQFSLSGGSVGLFEGKRIGRAKNLEKLEKEIKELNKRISQIKTSLEEKQAELSKLKENNFRPAIESLQEEINMINQDYVSVKTKKEQLAHMLTSNANKREDMLTRIEELTAALEELQPRLANEQAEYAALEEQMFEQNERLQEESDKLTVKSNAFNQENIKYHQHLNKVNSLTQEISYKQSAYESSKERIEKSQLELQQTDSEIKHLIDNNEVKDDELIALYDEKESIEAGVNEVEKDYYAARGEIDILEKQIREFQKSKEGIDAIIMELQNKLNEAKLNLSAVKERLSVEFNIDLEALMDDPAQAADDSTESEESLKQEVLSMRDKIEKIGPINPMAMEAYEEIKERHDFISQQRDDLISAKNSLMNTISEIDEVAKTTFLEAFDNIKQNFIRVFRSLFTEEDDCDLRLTDPSQPLDSSIEIIAKPKGKRPLTINQLSGGEKTLTATSLLFAIYLLKPAPFCIFDEVDAPLDDANIDKFNQIIQKFADESQFIIVTHNKRTMASTDIIYGITMIEQGVSRVVPVDLRELEEKVD